MKKLILFTLLISGCSMLALAQTKSPTAQNNANRPGEPIPGVGVNLGRKPGGGSQLKTIYPDTNGNFEFTKLEPGKYTLKLVKGEKASSVVSPRDAASGLPTGKRMHQPVAIKEQDTKSDTRVVKAEIVIEGDDDKPASSEKKVADKTEAENDPQIQLTIFETQQNSQKAGISTSRSNLRNKFSTLQDEGVEVEVGADGILKGNVLKTKHDTAKNSIGNIR